MKSSVLVLSFVSCVLSSVGCGHHAPVPSYHVTLLNVPNLDSTLDQPMGMAVDKSHNIYIADQGKSTIWRVSATGAISIAAGPGERIPAGSGAKSSGDGGPATEATLSGPLAVAVDDSGDLYIADSFAYRVRKVTNGIIETIAGCGGCGNRATSGSAMNIDLRFPDSIALDGDGNLLIADNCSILKLAHGELSLVAGGAHCSVNVSNGSEFVPTALPVHGTAAGTFEMHEIFIAGGAGTGVYAADPFNCRVWKIDVGLVYTLAGSGRSGQYFECITGGGDGVAVDATVRANGVAVDDIGNVFLSDEDCRIRMINAAGKIRTVANGFCGALAADHEGRIYVLDRTKKTLAVLEREAGQD